MNCKGSQVYAIVALLGSDKFAAILSMLLRYQGAGENSKFRSDSTRQLQ